MCHRAAINDSQKARDTQILTPDVPPLASKESVAKSTSDPTIADLLALDARRDLNRAEEIFQEGLAIEGIEEKDVFYERLEHLYEEQGRKDKSDEMRAALHRLKTSGPAVSAAPVQRASAKVGRNDLCPCGSGRKFKKCCGA